MGIRFSKAVLLIAWLAAVITVAVISINFSGESTQFHGITDDQEQTIRFTSAVQVVNYGFVAGQEVEPGALIVEVRRPDLDANLQIVQEQIHALSFGNRESRASMESEIVRLDADLRGTLTELDSQIRNLRARQDAAIGLLANIGDTDERRYNSPIEHEIESRRSRKHTERIAATARIDDLKSRLAATERPVDAQIAELQQQQQDLLRQQEALRVYAEFGGRVGSVLFKVGETVPPYLPVLTIHGSTPSFVKGYIHESVLDGVQLDQSVWIRSASSTHDNTWHPGVVESLGTRIVEFPERLKVNPLVNAWGREVVVRLSNDHSLLLGEKVSVTMDKPVTSYEGLKTTLATIVQ